MPDMTKHDIDFIHAKNKDRKLQQEKLKKFDEWLKDCPCEYEALKEFSFSFDPYKKKLDEDK